MSFWEKSFVFCAKIDLLRSRRSDDLNVAYTLLLPSKERYGLLFITATQNKLLDILGARTEITLSSTH